MHKKYTAFAFLLCLYAESVLALGRMVDSDRSILKMLVNDFAVDRLLISFVLVSALVLLLIAVTWLIHRFVFKNTRISKEALYFPSTLITSLLLLAFGVFALPEFAAVFESFGADLPVLTMILFKIPSFFWGIFSLFTLLFRYACINQACRGQGFLYLQIVYGLLLIFALWWLYLPIFKLC